METWDLYDLDRIKTGVQMIRGEACPPGHYHIVVHVCLFNEAGQMLIQERQLDKARWPGKWDFSAAGTAQAGETSRQAAERETLEELGLAISLDGNRPMLTVHFDHGFDDMYVLEAVIDLSELTLQESEVRSVQWASEEQILAMIEEDAFFPYHPELVTLLFRMRSNRGVLAV